jgi:hypothetical protein
VACGAELGEDQLTKGVQEQYPFRLANPNHSGLRITVFWFVLIVGFPEDFSSFELEDFWKPPWFTSSEMLFSQ